MKKIKITIEAEDGDVKGRLEWSSETQVIKTEGTCYPFTLRLLSDVVSSCKDIYPRGRNDSQSQKGSDQP